MKIKLQLLDDKKDDIKQLIKDLEISNETELINIALTFLQCAVKELKQDPDRIICSMNETAQVYKELRMPVFSGIKIKSQLKNSLIKL